MLGRNRTWAAMACRGGSSGDYSALFHRRPGHRGGRGRAVDREVGEVLGDVLVLVPLGPERAPVVGAPRDALAAGRELRLVAVDDRVKPAGFLEHEPAAGIDERARADAAATLVACNELLALRGAQRLPRGGGAAPLADHEDA